MRGTDDAAERAQAALRLLCEAKGADGGHLYLWTAAGLELAASLGPRGAPVGLLAAARAYLEAEVERTETTTMLVTAKGESAGAALSSFASDEGAPYRPLPIITELEGEPVYGGIALLRVSTRVVDQTGVPQLIVALGQFLIDAGDVRPLRSR
jgi:hypothetical protein